MSKRAVDPNFNEFYFEVAKGEVEDHASTNKFGRSTNVDNGIDTDIWDGANATDDTDIWVAPTQARTHQIASSDGGDASGGAGAKTIKVYGLVDWETPEVSETITMNGTNNVATANQYVIIHRMKVTSSGASGPNIGVIKATADTDGTVTAQINAGAGQTQMAIYATPANCDCYVQSYYASAIKQAVSTLVSVSLLVNEFPDSQVGVFLTKHTNGIATTGANALHHKFDMPYKIGGPAIIKLQANASSDNTDVSGGFDIITRHID